MSPLRFYPIEGDGFQPRLRPGSGIIAAPVGRYQSDGIYVFRDGSIYWADKRIGDDVELWLENPLYSRHKVPMAWFNANVEAIAVAEVNCRVRDFGRHLSEVRAEAERVLALAEPEAA